MAAMERSGRRLAVLVGLALTTLTRMPETLAQPSTPTKEAAESEARRFFHEGNAAYTKGDLRGAEAAYRKAWALAKSFGVASNLGLVSLKLGKHRDAAEHLAYALRFFPANGKPEHKKLLEVSFAKARAEVAEIVVQTTVEGAEVFVNGARVGLSPMKEPHFVDAGTCTLEAKREGYVAAKEVLAMSKGGRAEVLLGLKREAAAVPTATATASASATAMPTTPPPPRSAIPAFVLGGAAVLAAGIGIGMNVVAASDDASVKETADAIRVAKKSCVAGAANFDARCTDLESQARSAQTLSGASIGLLIGAGLVAGGALLYWFLPGAPPVKIGAVVVPEGGQVNGAVSVGGRF